MKALWEKYTLVIIFGGIILLGVTADVWTACTRPKLPALASNPWGNEEGMDSSDELSWTAIAFGSVLIFGVVGGVIASRGRIK